MKAFARVVGAVALAISGVSTCKPAQSQVTPSVSVAIDSVGLKDIGSDRVSFDVALHVTSDTKLKTKEVQFEQMRLGTMPVYLSPIAEPLQLEKGVPLDLPPVPLVVFYRDLDSLTALQQIVRDGSAKVTGNAHIKLDLNLLERLAVRQWTPTADTPIAVSTPVEMPGGFLGQAAALASLSAAQLAMQMGGSALSALRVSQKTWEQELKSRYMPSMVLAESRFTLRTHDDRKVEFVLRGVGFRISEDRFVLTDEMIQPWKYDTEVATAIKSNGASVVPESRDLLVAPGAGTFHPNTARSLARGEIRVEHQSDQSGTTNVATDKGPKAIPLMRRDSEKNYAVLRFNSASDKGIAVPIAPENARRMESWDRLSMFFIDHNGELELVSSPAHRDNQRIVLDDPIDSRGFGSLLIAQEGAVGMLQDEHQGMVLHTKW